jgi:hypothetical protein
MAAAGPGEVIFLMGLWYVDFHLFVLDLRMVIVTVWKVLRRKGIGEGGAPGVLLQPQMVQLCYAAGQAAAHLSQRLRIPQLAKQHAHKMIPARKSFGVPISAVFTNEPSNRVTISKIHHL